MRTRSGIILGLFGLSLAASTVRADIVVYSQDFTPTNGAVVFNGSGVYVSANVDGLGDSGGYVNSANSYGDANITTGGVGGASDYFLQDTTSRSAVNYTGTVWGTTNDVTVSQNTDYTFSFDLLTYNYNNPVITAEINGVALGGGVTTANDNDWEQFSFTWNSGSATTASLSLYNSIDTSNGDDFGVDSITLSTAVPEPSSVLMTGGGLFAAVLAAWRRRAARARALV